MSGFLVLSGEKDAKFILTLEDGRQIEVMIVAVNGPTARLGFRCDKRIRVNRESVERELQAGVRKNVNRD